MTTTIPSLPRMAPPPRFLPEPPAPYLVCAETRIDAHTIQTMREHAGCHPSDLELGATVAALVLHHVLKTPPSSLDLEIGLVYGLIPVRALDPQTVLREVMQRGEAPAQDVSAAVPPADEDFGVRVRTFDGPPRGAVDCYLAAEAAGSIVIRWWVAVPLCREDDADRLVDASGQFSAELAHSASWAAEEEAPNTQPSRDEQVTDMGFRVSPSLLEEALGTLPGLRDITLDGLHRVRVIADSPEIDEAQISSWVNGHLTPGHQPSFWSIITETDDRFSAVRRALGTMLGEELAVNAVQGTDTFFSLGGDSLSATRMMSRLHQELGVELDLAETLSLFTRCDVEGCARELERRSATVRTSSAPDASMVSNPDDRHEPFPLTDQQQAYLLGRGDTFSSGNIACHTYMEFEDRPSAGHVLDVARFKQAWKRVVARHDALRLHFDVDRITQRVSQDTEPKTTVVDLRGHTAEDAESHVADLREKLSHRVADVEEPPLYDLYVVCLPDESHKVLLGLDGLICDLAGINVLFEDLTRFYQSPESEQSPLSLTFRDYVLAERAATDPGRTEKGRDYWWRRLDCLPGPPDLPLAAAPEDITEPRFTPHAWRIDSRTWGQACREGAGRGITPSGIVAAAFASTLADWSRTRRFTLNVPCFNRSPLHPEVGQAVGEFASLILVEIDATHHEDFVDFATRVQHQIWQDLGHPEISGVSILRELMRRNGGYGRAQMPYVFTSTTALEGDPTHLLDGLLERTYRVAQTPQVWMDLIVEEHDGELVLNWDTLSGLFDEPMLEAMVASFEAQLRALALPHSWESPPLAPLTPAKRRQRLALCGPERPIPARGAHEAFFEQAVQYPEQCAVIDVEGSTTYADLATRARAIAGVVRRASRGQVEYPVAVLASPSADRIAVILGILAAGGVHVPLDTHAPSRRVGHILDAVGAGLIFTDRNISGEAWTAGRKIVAVENAVRPAAEEDVPLPTLDDKDPRALAYILFTSGSTGEPKGVAVEHRSVVNCIEATREAMPIGPGDRFLAVSATHHDMSVYDLFGVLGSGASLVIPDTTDHRDADAWVQAVRSHAVTGWVSVPTMMEMALERARAEDLSSLRIVILGGDWLSPTMVSTLMAAAPEAHVRSIGGPTETTVWNIWHPVTTEDTARRAIPYGCAIANTSYRILDERMRDRPDLVVGEMYCSGASLARGYWNDPARTAVSFVSDPATGERMYRTGDLGYFREDGLIEFAGRADHQLKIRGMRIEAGEIEACLLAHERISSAAVMGLPRQDRPGYRGIVAYVVPENPGRPPSSSTLREHMAGSLPDYMIPGTIVVLDELPLNPNGKLDRAALPQPDTLHSTAQGAPPQGALEEAMATLWGSQLSVPHVFRDDDFFSLGGDSLVAATLIRTMNQELPGVGLSLRDLFSHPTVAGLASAAQEAAEDPAMLEGVAGIWLEVLALDHQEINARLNGGAHA